MSLSFSIQLLANREVPQARAKTVTKKTMIEKNMIVLSPTSVFEKTNFLFKALYLCRGEVYLSHSSLFKLWVYDYIFLGQDVASVS